MHMNTMTRRDLNFRMLSAMFAPMMFLLATAGQDQTTTNNSNTKPSLNVMLMEADLLTWEACEQVRRASMFPTSVEHMGYWFCHDSILGRFVDYTTIKSTKTAHLVHYPLKRRVCGNPRFASVKDAYIFIRHSKDGKSKTIEHTEDEAYGNEFAQKAITTVELMAEKMCSRSKPTP